MAVLSKSLALSALLSCASAAQLIASHFSGTIYSLNLSDEGSLSITDQNNSAGQRIPAWITWDSAAKTAYVSDESWFGAGTGVFAAYTIGEDGKLSIKSSVKTDGGSVASGLFGGENGNSFIGEANYNAGTLTTWALPLSSSSKPLQSFKYTIPSPGPVPDRQDASHLHSVFTDPSGQYILAADLGADLIRVWSLDDASSGHLTECDPIVAAPGDGPRHGAFAEIGDETYLYIINELSQTVGGYNVTYPSGSGCLSADLFQSESTYEGETPSGVKAAEIQIVDDKYVYASNRNDETFGAEQDSIAVYALSDGGELESIDFSNAYGFFPRTFVINKAGDKVAVGGQTNAAVSIIERDPETGLLGELIDSINVGQRGTVNGEDGLSAVVWVE